MTMKSTKRNALRIDPRDNVVTLLCPVPAGTSVVWTEDGDSVSARRELPAGHKVAIEAIPLGGEIRKYGHPIGRAGEAIAPGEWVHTHNLDAVEG
jgi:altronate hydrolase